MSLDHERFKNVAAGIQSLLVGIGLIAGGLWTATTFVGLSQAKRAVAEAERAQAESELARRNLAVETVVESSITVSQLSGGKEARSDKTRWVLIEIALRNVGNKPVKLDVRDKMRFYISRVQSVDAGGAVTYSDYKDARHLRFDYPDKIIDWFVLRPKADYDRIHALQSLEEPGLYLARFSVQAADDSSDSGREYSTATYFRVE